MISNLAQNSTLYTFFNVVFNYIHRFLYCLICVLVSESESSSDSSSESSGTSSENSDSEEDIDDTKLLLEVRRQMEKTAAQSSKSVIPSHVKLTEASTSTPSPEIKFSGDSDMEVDQDQSIVSVTGDDEIQRPSIDIRLKEQFNLKDDRPPRKKRRVGLCEEIIISVSTRFLWRLKMMLWITMIKIKK